MSIIDKTKEKFEKLPKLSKQAKRNILLSASLVIICAAVFINWRISKGDDIIDGVTPANSNENAEDTGKVLGDSAEVSSDESDYFSVSVINRERVRDEAIETLREIAYGDDAEDDARQKALDTMTKLADDMTKEVNIENLVIAKGFDDCVAVIGDEDVSVIVKSEGLMNNEIAQIRDIVMSETGKDVSAIKIIEHK